jgi:hypothetical protein
METQFCILVDISLLRLTRSCNIQFVARISTFSIQLVLNVPLVKSPQDIQMLLIHAMNFVIKDLYGMALTVKSVYQANTQIKLLPTVPTVFLDILVLMSRKIQLVMRALKENI